VISKTQADHYFQMNRFVLSAKYYAQTHSVPFEQVVMKFMERDEMDALRSYIILILETKKNKVRPNDIAIAIKNVHY
jgi:hypothetical protein